MVCFEHFVGGKKTYVNNVPTITPTTTKQKPWYKRNTVKARNRVAAEDVKGHQQAEKHLHDRNHPEHDSLPLQSEEVPDVDDSTNKFLRAPIAGLLQLLFDKSSP